MDLSSLCRSFALSIVSVFGLLVVGESDSALLVLIGIELDAGEGRVAHNHGVEGLWVEDGTDETRTSSTVPCYSTGCSLESLHFQVHPYSISGAQM